MNPLILHIVFADGRREERTLVPGVYRIGRDEGDLVLGDPNTSAVHAELRVHGPSAAEIVDLGSTNGTFDGAGQRITTPFALRPHQPVRLGATTLTLRTAEPARGSTTVMPQFAAMPAPAGHGVPTPPPVSFSIPTSDTPPPSLTAARGTIIKVPDHSPGLLFIDGRQVQFTLVGTWRSAVAPAVNQVVEAQLDAAGAVVALAALESQQLALERLNELGTAAQKRAALAAGALRKNSGAAIVAAAAGVLVLAGVGAAWALGFGSDLSKRSLASKLNDAMTSKGHPGRECWALQSMNVTFPVTVEGGDLSGGPLKHPIVAGLIRGGYVTASQQSRFLGARPGPFDPTVIDLTAKGREEKVWDAAHGFCVGRRVVDEVVRWTEPSAQGGVQGIRIEYTWKLTDQPDWATEELFSEVAGFSRPVEAMAVASKQSDGWQIEAL
jgi:Inner membrane component of T3SS, cytoplasmic domain